MKEAFNVITLHLLIQIGRKETQKIYCRDVRPDDHNLRKKYWPTELTFDDRLCEIRDKLQKRGSDSTRE